MDWAREKVIPKDNDCYFLGTGIQITDRNPPSAGISVYVSPEIGNDLALLTLVNHTIMTYGTFGMWGALLAGSKRVILPKGYERSETIAEIIAANISGWTFI
ncbi:unnamed protein product [Sphagnum tenellum]